MNVAVGPLDSKFFQLDGASAEVSFDASVADVEGGVVDVPSGAVRPGVLWRLFRRGAAAVRITNEPAIVNLWHDLMPPHRDAGETAHGERLPWAAPMRELAANHGWCTDEARLGDATYMAAARAAYTCRRFRVASNRDTSALTVTPPTFRQGSGEVRLPVRAIESVWALGTRLFRALAPEALQFVDFAITVERRSYDHTLRAHDERARLFRDAGGPFSRIGHLLDEHHASAAGPFRHPLLRSAYSLGRLVPGVGAVLAELNAIATTHTTDVGREEPEEILCEAQPPPELFACFSARPEVVRTEYLGAHGWRELPVTPESLVIVPGAAARSALSLEPTRTRVVHTGGWARAGADATVVLGLSTRV